MLLRTFHVDAYAETVRRWCEENLEGRPFAVAEIANFFRPNLPPTLSVTLTTEEDSVLFLCAFKTVQYSTEESEDIIVEIREQAEDEQK